MPLLKYRCHYRNIKIICERRLKILDKEIHYVIVGNFETDGDYSINLNNYSEKFRKHIKCGDHNYTVNLETEDVYYARDFLHEMSVSFHVDPRLHWLLPNLYDLVEKIRIVLFDNEVNWAHETYGGNYYGTELSLRKVENFDHDKAEDPQAVIEKNKSIYFVCPRCKEEVNLMTSCCLVCGKKLNWEVLNALQPCSSNELF